ncbi:hypothetical protein [Thalassospira xiamenensis]|uniref:Uncharacterized protein n=1 Tax=Thalassospira xiamenensis TaxID=220697 RepID=A0A285TSE8_9PROT|nr:hypothetical protein [Thalassospira xiamenensis]SOC26813.1 hypothetical protein SAMN05428964_105213 [Thalassospira xiamenensis]
MKLFPEFIVENFLPDVAIFDFETSGLHEGSYPIEYGIATCDLDIQSALIKRHDTWKEREWDETAEREIHHISRKMLEISGIWPEQAVVNIRKAVVGRTAYTDSPRWDQRWVDELFIAVTGSCAPFVFRHVLYDLLAGIAGKRGIDAEMLIKLVDEVSSQSPSTHRAGPDVARWVRTAYALQHTPLNAEVFHSDQ